MLRMRTIDQAHAWIVGQDPDTAITKTALRRLVTTGQIPSSRTGNKYLINLDTLESYLSGSNVIPFPLTKQEYAVNDYK